jgi:hypothetical protein
MEDGIDNVQNFDSYTKRVLPKSFGAKIRFWKEQ